MSPASKDSLVVRGACGTRFLVKAAWLDRLFAEDAFLPQESVRCEEELKRTPSRLVRKVTLLSGDEVIVKTYLQRSGWDGLALPTPMRLDKDPEWSAGELVFGAGLTSAEPIAVGVRRVRAGVKRERVIVTRAVPRARDLRELSREGDLDAGSKRRFAAALGSLMRRMHDAGVFPRDPHMGNFLVRWEGDDCLVDPVDLREVVIAPDPSEEQRRRHLLLMFQTCGYLSGRTDRLRFLRSYLGEVPRSRLVETARFLEQEALHEIRAYRLRRSRAALGENRRFGVKMAGRLRWHVRWADLDTQLEEILADPEAAFSAPDALLKDGNSSTVAARGDFVIKRDNYKRPMRRLFDLFRPGRSLRALRRAFHLEISLLPTPRPVGAVKVRDGGLVRRGYLVVQRLHDARNIDVAVKEATVSERAALLRAAGRLMAHVHAAGFSHRDLKAGNIMVDAAGLLWLVDLDGIRPTAELKDQRRAIEISRLMRDLRDRSDMNSREESQLLGAYAEASRRGGFQIDEERLADVLGLERSQQSGATT